jgi:hypothetical protein
MAVSRSAMPKSKTRTASRRREADEGSDILTNA